MKLLLPVSVLVFAAGACCCCGGDFAEQLEKEGINVPDVGGAGSGGTTTGSKAHAAVPAGEKVKILDIGPDDAYVADKASIIGKTCVTDSESTYYTGDWHGGGVHCTDGSTYYFYNAAYEDLGPNPGGPIGTVAPPPTPTGGPPPAGSTLTELPSGTRVKILDVAPDDAYYSDKASIIGKTCTLQDTSSEKDGGWQGGQIGCDDGSSYYFYKAAYQKL